MPKTSHDGQRGRSFIEAARRAQIIQATIEVIAELGYAQATLEQIARRAGISRGLISYHFAGRDDLIEQVATEIFAAGAAFMVPQIAAATTPPGILRAYIESNLEYMHQHRLYMRAMVEIAAGAGSAGRIPGLDTGDLERGLQQIEQVLRWGQEDGAFRDFDTRVMAVSIRTVIDGIPAQLARDPDLDLGTYAQELVRLFDGATRVADDGQIALAFPPLRAAH